MKILIQCTYPAAPHFETELELALKYLEQGHEVFLLTGIDKFKFCYFNPLNKIFRDWLATNIFNRGINLLIAKTRNIANLNIIHYPKADMSNLDYPKVENIRELKEVKYKEFDIGLAIASSLISYKREHKLDVNLNRKLINNAFYTSALIFESAKLLLEKIQPDKVILFNGRFVENRPLLRLCEQLRVPYVTHERAGTLRRYLKRVNDVPHSITKAISEIEQLWLEGTEKKYDIGKSFFEDRRNRKQQGWHSYTKEQQRGLIPKGFSKDHKNIVIFNSSIDEFEGIDGYSNNLYQDENSAIEQICTTLLSFSNIKFYLRIHPNLKGLKNSQIQELVRLGKKCDNLHLIHADEDVDSYALMDNADLVLTFGSTMGIEAAFWGKPVIFAGRSFAEKLTCFYTPENHDEIITLLTLPNLPPLDNLDAIKYGNWELNYGEEFLYYEPTSVISGKFLGEVIKPTGIFNLLSRLAKILRRFK